MRDIDVCCGSADAVAAAIPSDAVLHDMLAQNSVPRSQLRRLSKRPAAPRLAVGRASLDAGAAAIQRPAPPAAAGGKAGPLYRSDPSFSRQAAAPQVRLNRSLAADLLAAGGGTLWEEPEEEAEGLGDGPSEAQAAMLRAQAAPAMALPPPIMSVAAAPVAARPLMRASASAAMQTVAPPRDFSSWVDEGMLARAAEAQARAEAALPLTADTGMQTSAIKPAAAARGALSACVQTSRPGTAAAATDATPASVRLLSPARPPPSGMATQTDGPAAASVSGLDQPRASPSHSHRYAPVMGTTLEDAFGRAM